MKMLLSMSAGLVLLVGTAAAGFAADQGMMENKMMMKPGEAMAPMTEHGTYAEFTQADFDAAKDMKRVLFFAASWCPTCMGTHKALQTSAAAIPTGTEVFKVDFDSSAVLKDKYGVTHMDTFVQVGKDGAKITEWHGGGAAGIAKNMK